MRAIFKDDIEKFDSFIDSGLDIQEVTEKEKWNFLHRALVSVTMKSTPRMINHLIGLNVDVNAADCYGNTPLHYATRSKDRNIIKLLIDAGANINHINLDGITPLRHMLLSKPIDIDIVDFLLSNGADLEYCSAKGISDREYIKTIAHGGDAQLLSILEKY